MAKDDDPLGDLLGAVKRTATGKKDRPDRDKSDSQRRGLNPMDLLTLPKDQRAVLNQLSRSRGKQMSLEELAAAVDKAPDMLAELLATLQDAGYLEEQVKDGVRYYSIIYSERTNRPKRRSTTENLAALLEDDDSA